MKECDGPGHGRPDPAGSGEAGTIPFCDAEKQTSVFRLTDLVADGVISAEEYSPRKEALLVKKTQLTDRLASFRRNGDPSLDRLELFVREAQHVRDVALTEKLDELTAFHRKIGSNFLLFGPERISRGVIGPRQRSRTRPSAWQGDGRSDRADGSSPAGEREESDNVSGGPSTRAKHGAGQAPQTRARRIKTVPGNEGFPGHIVTGDESVAGFIPVPFDPNRSPPTSFTKTGKPLRKIRQDGLPVLAVKFPGPWSLLASRPAGQKMVGPAGLEPATRGL